eukprot:Sspe_Gene.54486::Locus_30073_Transcript_1_1_Confidence_1.000_Length_3492::g.54486::m.54486
MQPFESIKFKVPHAEFAPKSSQVRPQTKHPPRSPISPAAGSGGRAVQLKKLAPAKLTWPQPGNDLRPQRPVLLPRKGSPNRSPPKTVVVAPTSPKSPPPVSPTLRPGSPLTYQLAANNQPHAFVCSPQQAQVYKAPHKVTDDSPVSRVQHPRVSEEGFCVEDLTPRKRTPRNLKKLDLSEAVPDPDAAPIRTPRFRLPKAVEVHQGAGPQVLERFAENLDEHEPGVDQALCYNVWAHTSEIFSETGIPTIDCQGTLFFTPSNHFGGSTIVTVTLSDNAAILGGEIKTSPPHTFTIFVHPSPIVVKKPKDWRSQTAKQKMPVALLSEEQVSEGVGLQWIFPPGNIHKLRERQRVKGHQDKGLRQAFGFCALERIHVVQYYKDHIMFAGGEAATESATEEQCLAELESAACPADQLKPLKALASITFARGGDSMLRSEEYLVRLVKVHSEMAGVTDGNFTSVKRSRSLEGDDTENDDSRTQSLERLAESLVNLARYYVIVNKLEAAEGRLCVALEIIKRVHGVDHTMHLKASTTLLECHLFSGDMGKARKVASDMLSSAALLFHEQDPALATILHLHAFTFLHDAPKDRHTDLVQQHYKAYSLRKTHTPNSAEEVESMLFVADGLRVTGSWQEALRMAEEAAVLSHGLDDEEHRRRLLQSAQLMCAHIAILTSRYKGAGGGLGYLEQAVETLPDGIDGLRGLLVLGAFKASQDFQDVGLLREVEGKLLVSLPACHPLVARCRYAIGAALLRQAAGMGPREKRQQQATYKEANLMLSQAYAAAAQHLPPGHLQLVGCLEGLGDLAYAMRDWETAFEHYSEARCTLESRTVERIRSPGYSGIVPRLYEVLAELVVRLDKEVGEDMVKRYQTFLELMQEAYGEYEPHNVGALQNLAELHYMRCEFDHAHHYLGRALSIVDNQNMHFLLGNLFRPSSQLKAGEVQERNRLAAERMTPLQCLLFGVLLSQEATVYEKQGKHREAESSYMQTIAAFEIAAQPQHLGVCYALDGLARLLYRQGLHGDALSYFDKAAAIRTDVYPYNTEEQEESKRNLEIIHSQVRLLGYELVRHEAPTKFPVYI